MTRELVVTSKEEAAEDVMVIHLTDPGGGPLPEWTPGAQVGVDVDGDVRQYSLCGPTSERFTWRIGVRRESNGVVSNKLHDSVSVGRRLHVSDPQNLFPLVPAERYVLIAGGIGITPLLPMVEEVKRAGREWSLYYRGRSRGHMAFRSEADGPGVTLWPEDEHGLLPVNSLLGEPRPGTAVYCCGPAPLIDAVTEACAAWPAGTLHVERFTPDRPGDSARPFVAELRRSKRTIDVPTDKSLLEAIEAAGISVLSSCRTGTCGTCEATVLDGEPEHHDEVLTDEERQEGKLIMLCVSRFRSSDSIFDTRNTTKETP